MCSLPQIWCKVGCVTVVCFNFHNYYHCCIWSFIRKTITLTGLYTFGALGCQFEIIYRCKEESIILFAVPWTYQVLKLEYNKLLCLLCPLKKRETPLIQSCLLKVRFPYMKTTFLIKFLGETYCPGKAATLCLSTGKQQHTDFKLSIQSICSYCLKVSASIIGPCKLSKRGKSRPLGGRTAGETNTASSWLGDGKMRLLKFYFLTVK